MIKRPEKKSKTQHGEERAEQADPPTGKHAPCRAGGVQERPQPRQEPGHGPHRTGEQAAPCSQRQPGRHPGGTARGEAKRPARRQKAAAWLCPRGGWSCLVRQD